MVKCGESFSTLCPQKMKNALFVFSLFRGEELAAITGFHHFTVRWTLRHQFLDGIIGLYRSPPAPARTLGLRPRHAAPVTFLSTLSSCEYLPDRSWQLYYELVSHLQPTDYMQRLQQGWRRFGWAIFRPECPSSRMCEPLRVTVATFRLDSTWKRNRTGHRTDRCSCSVARAAGLMGEIPSSWA
jgi:arginine-tRNA-protein transferase-like protein